MGDGVVRLRLVFDYLLCELAGEELKPLERCWFLVDSKNVFISDVASGILNTFKLQTLCPNGLILSMDDYVLPPFEPCCLLKDKDVIRVRKRVEAQVENDNMIGNNENALVQTERIGKQPVTLVDLPVFKEYMKVFSKRT